MNITVLGSTGRTGRLVVSEGLRRGHRITAFTRRPHTLTPPTPTRVVTGDGRDAASVRTALSDADAVVAIIAAPDRKGPHHAEAVARVLTAIMADTRVRRLAITSAYPIVGDRPRLPMTLLRRLFADAYADAARMEAVVSGSGLDWTIVRLNRLLDRPARGNVRVSRDLLARPRAISRADAATVLLDAVENPTHVRSAINIAGS